MKPLAEKVAVVAGAQRGVGRGIARMLGEAGATVYCTGRSSRTQPNTSGHHSIGPSPKILKCRLSSNLSPSKLVHPNQK